MSKHCNMCNDTEEAEYMIHSNGFRICSTCVDWCNQYIREAKAKETYLKKVLAFYEKAKSNIFDIYK